MSSTTYWLTGLYKIHPLRKTIVCVPPGEIFVDGEPYDIRYKGLEFDGWNQLHWTNAFNGERYSLVWFTPDVSPNEKNIHPAGTKPDDELANRLAEEHNKKVQFLTPLQFRLDSTDAVVINELLDSEKGSAYMLKPNTYVPSGFSLKNHQCVLDVGAHIGVFSRLAISEGCQRIIAYEPEPSNFELLQQNLGIRSDHNPPSLIPSIELHSSAVAQGLHGSRTLVKARNENSGKLNSWRHCLEEHSQYIDITTDTDLPSKAQQKTLQRISVECTPFFGSKDRTQTGALMPGVTFVKIDCEGAEIDILLSEEASQQSSWLDTTHLVVEFSLTKERRVNIFHKAIDNLQKAGFEVYYEGIGSWWDTDEGVMWPYPNDLIVFAMMQGNNKQTETTN